MKTAGIVVLSVAGTLATAGVGYGLYQAGAAQSAPAQQAAAVTPAEAQIEARVEAAVAAALAARDAVTPAPAPVQTVAPVPAPVVAAAVPVAATVATTVHMEPVSTVSVQVMPERARVIRVQPQTVSWQEPREVCEWITVQRTVPAQNDTRVARTLLGAAAGGLLGNQIGGGNGKKVATVIGALAGAQVGHRSGDQQRQVSTQEQRCYTVSDTRSRQDGFLVTYEYRGVVDTVHTRREPGAYLPVDNGRVLF